MRHAVLLFGSVLLAAGCDPVPATSLEDVQIPEGHTFETTRQLGLVVEVDDQLAQDEPKAALEVRKPDGGLIYLGTLGEAQDGRIEVETPLSLDTGALEVTVRGSGWSETAAVEVGADGSASYTVERS